MAGIDLEKKGDRRLTAAKDVYDVKNMKYTPTPEFRAYVVDLAGLLSTNYNEVLNAGVSLLVDKYKEELKAHRKLIASIQSK